MAPIKFSVEYLDYCASCEKKTVTACCDRCGDSVCGKSECCRKFPNYNAIDTIFCTYCLKKIESNFKEAKEPEPTTYRAPSYQYN